MTSRPPRRRGWLLAAAMVGVATLLVPKADPKAHWSTPPPAFVVTSVAPGGDSAGT